MKHGPNYVLFSLVLVFATAVALSIIPGLDILAWHLLHPVTFWQRFGLVAVEALTAWPRFVFGMFVWGALTAIGAKISE